MNIRFKGHNHPVQGFAGSRLVPQYLQTVGTPVHYNGEVIGEVDAVVDDEVVVKLKPGCEGKFLELVNNPTVHVSAGNPNCKPKAEL